MTQRLMTCTRVFCCTPINQAQRNRGHKKRQQCGLLHPNIHIQLLVHLVLLQQCAFALCLSDYFLPMGRPMVSFSFLKLAFTSSSICSASTVPHLTGQQQPCCSTLVCSLAEAEKLASSPNRLPSAGSCKVSRINKRRPQRTSREKEFHNKTVDPMQLSPFDLVVPQSLDKSDVLKQTLNGVVSFQATRKILHPRSSLPT